MLFPKPQCSDLLFNLILHGGEGGIKSISPNGLSYTNHRGMPWMFLSILERFWVGHFWDFFLKLPKNFTSTIFSVYNPKGGPFYASVWTPFARNFFVFFWVKNGNNSTLNALIMGKNNQFLPKHAFLPSLNHFSSYTIQYNTKKQGGSFWPPPHVLTYIQKPM